KNTDTVYVSDEGATILKISKPDDYEKVKISAYGLSRLSGDITVVGMSTGEEKKYKFSTDEYGSYEVTITARVGDAVEIFGVSVKDSDETYGVTTTTYYPQRVSFE